MIDLAGYSTIVYPDCTVYLLQPNTEAWY
jgi:hypothetical protein